MTRDHRIEQQRRIKTLRKYLRQSKLAVRAVLAFGAIVLMILLALEVFLDVPWWVYVLLLWVVPFGLIGDGINILYVNRKLRTLKREADPAATSPGGTRPGCPQGGAKR
jgi:hypothetical protein